MTDRRAASIKGWEVRKRILSSRGYGPKGRKRGTERHKVKSISEILARVRANLNQPSGQSSTPNPDRTDEAGGNGPRNAIAARETVLRQAQDGRCSPDVGETDESMSE